MSNKHAILSAMAAVQNADDLTDMQALQAAGAFAVITLRKMGSMRLAVDPWPDLHVEISPDSGDGTASVAFTWKLAEEAS
jgi:hypothetical protein